MAETKTGVPTPAELNQQFGGSTAPEIAQPSTESRFSFPTEIVDLPSRGLLYDQGSPLASGKIEMKYMTAREEDILSSPNLARQGVILDKLFQSLMVTPFNYDDLYIGDRNAIMVAARLLAYGKDYTVEMTDPTDRSSKQKVTIDLTTIKAKQLDFDSIFEPGRKEYFFTLPKSEVQLGFKFLTVGDEKRIKADIESQKNTAKREGVSREFTTRLKHMITSVDGERSQDAINEFVDKHFLAIDSRAFREYVKAISPDVDFTFQFRSESTGQVVETEVPVDLNFFWPKS